MSVAARLAEPRRYLWGAIACAVAHNAVMMGADFAGIHYVGGTLISLVAVSALGYVIHASYTFRAGYSVRGATRFFGTVAAAYPLSLLTMAVLCTGFNLPVIVAAPAATALLFVVNFLGARWAIRARSVR